MAYELIYAGNPAQDPTDVNVGAPFRITLVISGDDGAGNPLAQVGDHYKVVTHVTPGQNIVWARDTVEITALTAGSTHPFAELTFEAPAGFPEAGQWQIGFFPEAQPGINAGQLNVNVTVAQPAPGPGPAPQPPGAQPPGQGGQQQIVIPGYPQPFIVQLQPAQPAGQGGGAATPGGAGNGAQQQANATPDEEDTWKWAKKWSGRALGTGMIGGSVIGVAILLVIILWLPGSVIKFTMTQLESESANKAASTKAVDPGGSGGLKAESGSIVLNPNCGNNCTTGQVTIHMPHGTPTPTPPAPAGGTATGGAGTGGAAPAPAGAGTGGP